MISGVTRLAGVIGDPVRHSLSPALHNAAYRELGLDWVYVAFEVPDGRAGAALDALRTLDLVGLSVTMPHKTVVADQCDELTEAATAMRSVNTVTRLGDGRLHGDSTDGEGLLRALRDGGCDPAGARVLVLGAGGAARAVVDALQRAGAAVDVAARRPDAATATGGNVVNWDDRDRAARTVDIVVNATPIGMGDGAAPLSIDAIVKDSVYADLVYHPLETPLLAAARAAGAATIDGLGMLVHQAALQVERWAARPAPVEVMRAAALAALGSTSEEPSSSR
ncbi:MAG: shikimate dehydrogenase [Actinomycetota bacterium]